MFMETKKEKNSSKENRDPPPSMLGPLINESSCQIRQTDKETNKQKKDSTRENHSVKYTLHSDTEYNNRIL